MRLTNFLALFLSLGFTYSALLAQAQETNLLQIIAGEACQCLERADLDNALQPAEQLMENCIKSAIIQHASAFMQNDIHDPQAVERMGGEIATILFQDCPKFVEFSIKLAEKERANTTQGTFIKLNVNELAYFILDKEGQKDAYVWLDPFPGWEKFSGDMRNYTGKTMVIQWQSIQLYDPRYKIYNEAKKVVGIQVIE